MSKYQFTVDQFKSELSFDVDAGVIVRLFNKFYKKSAPRAGSFHKKSGYRRIRFRGVKIEEHQLIWFIANGYWANEIDHKNGVKDDNRICNLRSVTHVENLQNNRRARSHSRSGHLGVYWIKSRQKWDAQIKVNGKAIHLGEFVNIEDAISARKSAELIYYPTKPQSFD